MADPQTNPPLQHARSSQVREALDRLEGPNDNQLAWPFIPFPQGWYASQLRALVEQTEIFERDAAARLDRAPIADLTRYLEKMPQPGQFDGFLSRVQRDCGRVRRSWCNCPKGQWRGAPKLRIMGCNEGTSITVTLTETTAIAESQNA